ncbi:MAG: AAA family ATPase [Anaerolineales bacterium]|nr:AAA family ATPase [Anaerolineales bacterium]MCB8954744.1 AAA family ATPase [Ardenticatenales bacterium]
MQNLTIENFGPIKQAEIEIRSVLVFIGPQASGKSTISKAIYFFKSLRDDLFRYLLDILNGIEEAPAPPGYSLSQFGRRARDKFLGIYGPVAHFALMRLYYDYGNGVYVAVVPSNDGLGFTNVWLGGSFGEKFKLLVQDTVTFRQKAEELRRDRFLSSRETLRFEAEQ